MLTAWDDDVIYSTYVILQQTTLATYYNNQSPIVNLRQTAEMLIESGPRKTNMDGSQDSSRKEDYRRCRTGHEIHLEIEDVLYKKAIVLFLPSLLNSLQLARLPILEAGQSCILGNLHCSDLGNPVRWAILCAGQSSEGHKSFHTQSFT